MRARIGIATEIKRKQRAQGEEIRASDVGRPIGDLGEGFGTVLACDVGKRVWSRSFGTVMENADQRDARRAGGAS